LPRSAGTDAKGNGWPTTEVSFPASSIPFTSGAAIPGDLLDGLVDGGARGMRVQLVERGTEPIGEDDFGGRRAAEDSAGGRRSLCRR